MSFILCAIVILVGILGYFGSKKHEASLNNFKLNDLVGSANIEAIRLDMETSREYAAHFINHEYRETYIYDFLEEDLIDLFGENFEAELEFLEFSDESYCALSPKYYLWEDQTRMTHWLCQLWTAKDIGKFCANPYTDTIGYKVSEDYDIREIQLRIAQKIEMYLQKHGHKIRFLVAPWYGNNLTGRAALQKHSLLRFEPTCRNDLRGRDPELFRLWETRTYDIDPVLKEREKIYETLYISDWLDAKVPLDIEKYKEGEKKRKQLEEEEGAKNLESYKKSIT